jgi:hypothetical protein
MKRRHEKAAVPRIDQNIDLISTALNAAKAKAIKRIVKQLERMSPQDVTTMERLIGRR